MICGIGVDAVSIERMEQSLARFGDRIAQKILSDTELPDFTENGRQGRFLAKRFAAKEALAKAFGTGFRDGLTMRDISVVHTELGCPRLLCTGQAFQLMREKGIINSHLSLSDEREFALAFVTLETA